MLAINFGLTLLAANIAIHTQEARGASSENVTLMTRQLAISAALRTEQTTSTTQPKIVETCLDISRCVSAVRVETGASHVVLVRIINLPSRIRLTATLMVSALDKNIPKATIQRQTEKGPEQFTIDLNHDSKTWPKEFANLSDQLFASWKKPNTPPMIPPLTTKGLQPSSATTISFVSQTREKETEWLWKWAWIGSGALLATGGMVADTFMPSSHNQRLDNEDFIGPGLIIAGILAGISKIYLNPHQESDLSTSGED